MNLINRIIFKIYNNQLKDVDKKKSLWHGIKKKILYAYYNISKLPAIAIDDALILANVEDCSQPETNIRRINGKRLTDEEMIAYYTDLENKYEIDDKLNGYFLKGLLLNRK